MYNDKFEQILEKNEKIIWTGNINVFDNTKKIFLSTIIFAFFPLLIIFFINKFYFIIFAAFCLFIIAILNKSGCNTYFCITNKRIIKRKGAFKNKFIHYPIKNIALIQLTKKNSYAKNQTMSINLFFEIFFKHSSGVELTYPLEIKALNYAYEAFDILIKLTKNNKKITIIKP